jgi:hypothetical protein
MSFINQQYVVLGSLSDERTLVVPCCTALSMCCILLLSLYCRTLLVALYAAVCQLLLLIVLILHTVVERCVPAFRHGTIASYHLFLF